VLDCYNSLTTYALHHSPGDIVQSLVNASSPKQFHHQSIFVSQTVNRNNALTHFLHETCIAGLVKQLSQYTGRISE